MTAPERRRTVLSLGGNLGDRTATLQRGLDALFGAPGLEFVALSPSYETRPVGGPPQGDFLNVVVVADGAVPPHDLLQRVQQVEHALGRDRTVHWGPRTLDIDIVTMGDLVSGDPGLTLPHPRAHERAFVLVPWADADPDAVLPGRGPVRGLLAAVADQEIHRRDDLSLRPPT